MTATPAGHQRDVPDAGEARSHESAASAADPGPAEAHRAPGAPAAVPPLQPGGEPAHPGPAHPAEPAHPAAPARPAAPAHPAEPAHPAAPSAPARSHPPGAPHTHHDHADLARLAGDSAFWDERYRTAPALWSGRPNVQLVAETADLPPGTALEVGCGEGADATWLAARGWRVTGVDVSEVALRRAAEHARDLGAEVANRIDWLHADLTRDDPPATYDLVSSHFVQLPPPLRRPLHRALARATAPGGTLLVVAHHPVDVQAGVPRPPAPELFFTAEDVAAELDPAEWTVEVAETRPRSTVLEGTEYTIHDAVLRARRTSDVVAEPM